MGKSKMVILLKTAKFLNLNNKTRKESLERKRL